MSDLARHKPSPIPAIHPVPEYLADGELAAFYDETKRVMQVPWMGVVTMAFAHYRTFYGTLWTGLGPMVASRDYVEACADLRREIETAVEGFSPPPIASRLADIGYAPREIAGIRNIIEIFSHGNLPYCLLATQARLALEQGVLPTSAPAEPYPGRHAPAVEAPLVLMEAHHADAPIRAVFDDIKATLGLPFVNTDYRGLARWPSYFALAWSDLKPVVTTDAYEKTVASLHESFVAAALRMPNPADLTAKAVREAAAADAPLAEVIEVCRLFQWLLPGLITNVAFLRQQLLDS